MFMAELKNLLLTAGHDLEAIQLPVRLDVSTGSERYILLNGQEQVLKPGDMMMADEQGIISSVLYGPDRRTRITPDTRRVLFAVYAPAGIGEQAVRQHLQDIQTDVMLVAPDAEVESLEVYVAG
jgi:DNA/RNA-binding domain of Phe-tRNA-synthetase-like protein